MSSHRVRGASALFASAFIYSTFGILIRQMALMFGDSAQTAFRFGVAFIILLVFYRIRKQSLTLSKSAMVKASLLGIIFGCVVLLFTVSVNNTKIANSVFLLYAGSIISSLVIGTVWLKERLTPIKILAILVAFVGLYMYSNAILILSLGIVTGLISGVLDGAANALRKTLRGQNRNAVLSYQFAFSALFAALVLLFSGEAAVKEILPVSLLAGILFALLQIGLGNLLLYGFQHFDVNAGTVILASELFFASILGFLLFQEVPATKEFMGGGLIFLASVLSTIDVKKLFSA